MFTVTHAHKSLFSAKVLPYGFSSLTETDCSPGQTSSSATAVVLHGILPNAGVWQGPGFKGPSFEGLSFESPSFEFTHLQTASHRACFGTNFIISYCTRVAGMIAKCWGEARA